MTVWLMASKDATVTKLKTPLYVLPHDIEVIGEYPPGAQNRYWRVRIRPHRFFPDVPIIFGGQGVRRSRVILASKLGRQLSIDDLAHHGDEDVNNDSPQNIELLSPTEHNRHHKLGFTHSEATKARISASLKRAIQEGRRKPPTPPDWLGRKHTEESRRRISTSRKAAIAAGQIAKPVPPSTKGRSMPAAAKESIRAAKLEYWANKRNEKP